MNVNFLEKDVSITWSSLDNYFNKDHSQKYPKIHFDFIRSLIKKNLKNILITGTCLEYGIKTGKVKEKSICKPNTEYGRGKNKLLLKLNKLNKKIKFNLIWLRLFYIYSDNPKLNTILSELNKKTKKNKFFTINKPYECRDFIDIKKIIKIIFRLSKIKRNFGVVNLGSGKPQKIKNIVKKFVLRKKISDKKIIMNENNQKEKVQFENKNFWADITKLKKIIHV